MAEKQKEKQAAGNAGAAEKPAEGSPTVTAPQSPVTTPAENTAAKSFAGKFDPKAIAKKAAPSSNGAGALGMVVEVPVTAANSQADQTNTNVVAPTTAPQSLRPLKVGRNVNGFGLGSKTADTEKPGNKRALDFEDDESSRKKLGKLPTLLPDDSGTRDDTALANDAVEEGNNDADMADGGDEEENLAAMREAAAKRAEAEKGDQDEKNPSTRSDGDVQMSDAPESEQAARTASDPQTSKNEEEDEEDPLDAFMSGLDKSLNAPKKPVKSLARSGQKGPELMLDDEGELAVDEEASPEDILAMAQKKAKQKEVVDVDHSKMNYSDVRFKFYTEPEELAAMSAEEVASMRLELDGMKVYGQQPPTPIQHWAQSGLSIKALDVINRLGFEKPTPIQAQAIPIIMSGRDVLGVSKTGSGKTLAFVLPMFRHILDQPPVGDRDGPIGMIMAPTRELANQIYREIRPFAKVLGLRVVVCGGGAPIKDQIAELKKGAEIVVCTPGRMIELLAANSGRVTNLNRITYVVLDEADRMYDMGFQPQIAKIVKNVRPKRQTVLFSATFPKAMEKLAKEAVSPTAIQIVVGGLSKVAPEITQIVEVREEESKFHRLLEILGELYDKDEEARTLIFVERQAGAEDLLNILLKKGYSCDCIHGRKDQEDRDSVLHDFKNGAVPILIATSVAARGLDVKQLKLVVNYDVPNHLEDYVHRAGRTGRAGQKGTAVTFITPSEDRFARDIKVALQQSGQPIPEKLQELVDHFGEKLKAGKEKIYKGGFKGKGLEHLDKDRDSERQRERKAYKSGDDEQEEEKEEKESEIVIKAAGTSTAQPAGVPKGINLDGEIIVHKREVPPPGAKTDNPMEKVRQAVNNIGDRLNQRNQLRPGQPIDNKGPDAGAFHATLEINDFPQKARWAVTNRTNVAKILEATGTSITTKGNFYGPGKTPAEGEPPKLYILVEGETEVVVQTAMRELMRLLKEGTIAAEHTEARPSATGRYSVV
ncbi:uncharacterized protein K452DRAFT_305724 [Aplosporella prunicola CBS 121167]|uniref:RNA helicase n=1 Tax=Aplosporella prunicola CBS 121167 TaxID=1176127 RepID=A0A6A6BR42_9PEZI|nr:uncharacterized protein K452DRAFT_305724 [Aplosporella prunicola CBS 121167]KAF2145765.1 hypothetical protein K452DRAFT_305724 [Aplosporella prunicola CBS 121167]